MNEEFLFLLFLVMNVIETALGKSEGLLEQL
jgi:hypothetical protein